MYLSMSKLVINRVLLRVNQEGAQLLAYYVNKTIIPVEQRYTCIENVALALHMAIKKMCP